ncbi:uncharacterized protein LOC124293054 isoform X1 [Neodiprion lecontei]|uniref:Uncharacterized protein LOC124293054 isoform X1 n=1 Tax=Neodiprion lecontei TaxID=441921 RepID=A0ABM3FJ28_NEOLC|nr:uncharacterized protein LOC124293054 isoform X1 [Neodiprion lecontei]
MLSKARNSLGLIFVFVILGEILPPLESKTIRPYKYHHSRSPHRSRWHPGPRRPKWHPPRKRPPPRHYPRYKPKYHRYPPSHYENGIDYASDEQPYTIEIELPRRFGGAENYHGTSHIHSKRGPKRGEVYDESEYDEFLEDEYYDEQDRVIRTGRKKVRIKVIKGPKPKLNIRISRIDDERTNGTETYPLLQPQISTNIDELGTQLDEEWMPVNPKPSYPVHLRGAR